MGLPGGAAFLPLVIGELFELGAVEAHDEDLAVGLLAKARRSPSEDPLCRVTASRKSDRAHFTRLLRIVFALSEC